MSQQLEQNCPHGVEVWAGAICSKCVLDGVAKGVPIATTVLENSTEKNLPEVPKKRRHRRTKQAAITGFIPQQTPDVSPSSPVQAPNPPIQQQTPPVVEPPMTLTQPPVVEAPVQTAPNVTTAVTLPVQTPPAPAPTVSVKRLADVDAEMDRLINETRTAALKQDAAEAMLTMVQVGELIQQIKNDNSPEANAIRAKWRNFGNEKISVDENGLPRIYSTSEPEMIQNPTLFDYTHTDPKLKAAVTSPVLETPATAAMKEEPVFTLPSWPLVGTPGWKSRPFPLEYVGWFRPKVKEIAFDRPVSIGISGAIESGKTSFIEAILIKALQHDHAVLMLGGAEDQENLTVLRSPFRDRVVIIKGKECKLSGNHVNTIDIDDFDPTRPGWATYYVLDRAFFGNDVLYSNAIVTIANNMIKRHGWREGGRGKGKPLLLWVGMPEAADIVEAKIIAGQSRDERDAVKFLEKLNRKSAHAGVCLVFDFQRETSISADLRTVTTYRVFTKQGYMRVDPNKFRWVFAYVKNDIFRALEPGQAIIIHRDGGGCLVKWPLASFHIIRGEDVLGQLGIHLFFDQELIDSQTKALTEKFKNQRAKVITDDMGDDIIERHEVNGESLRSIAMDLELNPSTVSVWYKTYKAGLKRRKDEGEPDS